MSKNERVIIEMTTIFVVLLFATYLLYQLWAPKRELKSTLSCESNLKQLGTAIEQYAQDYDTTLPRPWYGKDAGPSDTRTNYKWMDVILPYVKAERLFDCPNDQISKIYHYRDGLNYGSYVYNNAYYASADKLTPPGGHKLSEIAGMTVMVMDGQNNFQFAWPDVKSAPKAAGGIKLDTIVCRHSGVPVTLWCNGLVQAYPIGQVASMKVIHGQQIMTGFTIQND